MATNNVAESLDLIQADSFTSDAERFGALRAAKRLVARLETPFERTWSLVAELPHLIAGIQVCQNLGLWKKWTQQCKANGNGPQHLDDILGMIDVAIEANLLRRFLRHFSATGTLEETGVDKWKLTPLTMAIGDDALNIDLLFAHWLDLLPPTMNLSRFLAKNGYKEPLDPAQFDNFTDVYGAPFFTQFQKDPAMGLRFNGLITAVRDYKMDWTEVYDTTQLVQDADLTEFAPPLFVDIGGLHGVDTKLLLSKHPELPQHTKLVVQDLPEVVNAYSEEQLDTENRISRMAYDFFTPQPLLGARVYFFHGVPHDWPDGECVKILENVKSAMRRGYSKLLIYEMVVPAKGASAMVTTLDLCMMSVLSALERTEEQWRGLLEGVGLKIVSISRHPMAVESVIEAALA